jgi:uncharacterized protein (TIGR02466 family)
MQPVELRKFWVPFFAFSWPEAEAHREELKKICHQLEDEKNHSGVAPGAKQGLYESKFDFCDRQEPSIVALTQFISQSIFTASAKANQDFWQQGENYTIDIYNSWCHITRKNGIHYTHNHGNSAWSAVYYIDIGSSDMETADGVTRFYNPIQSSYDDPGTRWCTQNSAFDMPCQNGLLSVFPSWIYHGQQLYTGDDPRYVVAVNSKVHHVAKN